MTTQPIIERFRKLSSSEKLRLLQELWDEVAEDAARMPLSEAHRELLDERLRQHDENPDDVEPWDMVREETLSNL